MDKQEDKIGKLANLSSDSAPSEKRSKRERKSSEVQIKSSATATATAGGSGWSNDGQSDVKSGPISTGFQL